MSLKHIHTLFIIFAILCDFAYFVFLKFYASPELQEQAGMTGVFGGLFGLALLIYLPFHLRKVRKLPE